MDKSKNIVSFSVVTLGCKVNQFESETIAQELKQSGIQRLDKNKAPGDSRVDTCIINTCTVTAKAATDSRKKRGPPDRGACRKIPDSGNASIY